MNICGAVVLRKGFRHAKYTKDCFKLADNGHKVKVCQQLFLFNLELVFCDQHTTAMTYYLPASHKKSPRLQILQHPQIPQLVV